MDPTLQTLLSWQFFIFGLSIASVVLVIRTVIEFFTPAKSAKIWNELILPIMPIILGGVVGRFFVNFPYPDGLTHKWDRVVFGLVAGLLSTFMYRLVKGAIPKKQLPQIINVIIGSNEKVIEINKEE